MFRLSSMLATGLVVLGLTSFAHTAHYSRPNSTNIETSSQTGSVVVRTRSRGAGRTSPHGTTLPQLPKLTPAPRPISPTIPLPPPVTIPPATAPAAAPPARVRPPPRCKPKWHPCARKRSYQVQKCRSGRCWKEWEHDCVGDWVCR